MSGRITTSMLSSNYLRNMQRNLTNMKTMQNQLASGKNIQKASENPYIASRSMQLNAEISANKQYNENIKDTTNWLDTTDTALSQMGNVFGRIETLLVNGGNGTYDVDEKNAIRDEVKEKVNELSQILNTSFDGSYIFGGTKTDSKPTTVVNGVLQYADVSGSAVTITAYKDSSGKITSDKSSAQYTLAGYALGSTTITAGDITTAIAAATSSDRIQDIENIKNGAPLYYTGTLPVPPAATITIDQLTSEKYITNQQVTSQLTDDQKNALIAERNITTTTEERKEDITKLLQGAKAYEKVDPATRLVEVPIELTSEKYKNTEITLSSTDITDINKKLQALEKLTLPTGDDNARIDDINSMLYNTTETPPVGTPLQYIKSAQKAATPTPDQIAYLDRNNKTIPINQIHSDLQVDIGSGIKSEYNKTAVDVLEFTDKSGKTINVSELLTNIMADLKINGDTNSLCTTHLKDIQSVTSNLLQQRSAVGTMQNRMDSAQSNNETQNYNMTDILSKTEDIDFADKTMEYSMMQTVYTAALQVSAKVLPMTILNYL